MGYKGKYVSSKPQKTRKPASKGKKILVTVLVVLLVLIIGVVAAAAIYWNMMLGMLSDPAEVTRPPMSDEEYAAMMDTDAESEIAESLDVQQESVPETTAETSPEDTWPEIVSDKNITNIMLIGQAARPGEEALIADTMILVSINRETKTLTMTSLMRDLRLVWPKYVDVNGQPHTGNNRINMAYNMGYRWDGNIQGGMNVLSSIVEYNFGVPVDHSVEVNFEIFENVINIVGGVEVDISEAELKYLQSNYNWMDKLVVGINNLDGYQALCYARARHVDNADSDFNRTERQREVITALLNKLKGLSIMEIHKMFTEVLPLITTDMTSKEITNYAFEFIPMLKDLTIQSQRIPFDNTYWPIEVEIDGRYDNQLECNVKKNGELLRESIGMTAVEE